MKNCGIMEVVRIRRGGFPIRESFGDFVARFNDLKEFRRLDIPIDASDKEHCRLLLLHFFPTRSYCKFIYITMNSRLNNSYISI